MFWFNRNPGLSLPLIALQYHEVKIIMEFRNAAELIVGLTSTGDRDTASNTTSIRDSSGVSLVNAALWVDYVYLDEILCFFWDHLKKKEELKRRKKWKLKVSASL